MRDRRKELLLAAVVIGLVAITGCGLLGSQSHGTQPAATTTVRRRPAAAPSPTGMPRVVDPTNIYSEQGAGMLDKRVAGDPPTVYVPNGKSDTVTMIDPTTKRVVGSFAAGREPQHIVPSYDLRTLWELNNQGNSLIPIDPRDRSHGAPVAVQDPYNLYFTPDGGQAIVVAEALRRLDFRDPKTMALVSSLAVPGCDGVNHSDYAADGRYAIFTCEFAGKLVKIDMVHRSVVGYLSLGATSMPQDIRAKADGRTFYVADMMANGVYVVDGDAFTERGFIPTGLGAHGLNPSRDGRTMYVANRGTDHIGGPPHGKGSVSVLDMASDKVTATWPVPGGGSPDMGNITADGHELWLSGRYDDEVYVFDLVRGGFETRIKVGRGPHGLAVWPQPGRFSLGHTGNMR